MRIIEIGEPGWLLVATVPNIFFIHESSEPNSIQLSHPMLCTVNQACQELGISRTKMYQLIYGKQIEVV